ncbi:MAG: hypothetical protein CW336_01880 [Bacteroidetes bacterium]|nr:hypothetical protein [Bacteroidota bacterium]
MIKNLSIENFKCFDKNTSFDLSKVNLFVGYNGRGKSSVIQSFLLLCQTLYHYGKLNTMEVNGEYVQLGLFEDLINISRKGKDPIHFVIETDQKEGHNVVLAYEEKTDAERLGQICELEVDGINYLGKQVMTLDKDSNVTIDLVYENDRYPDGLNTIFQNCNYVAAERKGPSLYEEKRDKSVNNPVGKNGEHVLNNIAKNEALQKEINYWVNRIMDGGGISLKGEDKSSSVLSLNFAMPNASCKDGFKSINCGFGYSYVLSIVVNALTMEKGTLVIENPEAHLHPTAQLRLTELLAKVSSKDIQIFIETHSEHIVNGFRIYALRDDFEMKHDDLSIYFFDEDYSIKHLKVEANGRIKNWPNRFFDQFEWEMTEIIKLGRGIKC